MGRTHDGLKEALANDPVPPELAEELDRRYQKATEATSYLINAPAQVGTQGCTPF